MSEYEKKLAELKELMGYTDPESLAKKEKLFQWIEENGKSEDNQKSLDSFIEDGIEESRRDIAVLREQIGGVYDLLPIAYIARHYFGKSRAWLYQRLNGAKVRNRVYTLNDEQKGIFNSAVQDIARKIGSIQLS